MKKVISFLLSTVMLVSTFASVDLSAYAVDSTDGNNFDIQDFFDNYQNKADDFNYLQYISQHYTSDGIKNTIEFRINQETNCNNLVGYLNSNLWFQGSYAIWETATFVTNPVDTIEKQLNKETYYETIILRILNSSVTSDNAIDWLNQGAIKNSIKISENITQASETKYYAYLANKHLLISDFTDEEYNKTIEFTKNYINSQNYKKFGNDVSFIYDVLSMSKDIEEYSERLASYCQLIELGDSIADFLDEIKNNSDNNDLIKAIDNVVPIIRDSYSDMLKTAAKDGLYCIGSFALKKIVGETWKKCLINLLNNGYLFNGTAIVGSVFLAIGITKTFSNIAFSTDAKLDKYELMKALCSFEQSMEAAMHRKINTFENTDEYANILLEGVSILYQTYIVDTEVYSEMTKICQNDWIGNLSRDEYEKIIDICNYNKELYQNEYDSLKIVSGVCGDTLGWAITFDKELLIYGIGEMYDFEKEKAPWYDYKDMFNNLYISKLTTVLGGYAFYNCDNIDNNLYLDHKITIRWECFDNILSNVTLISKEDLLFFGCQNINYKIICNGNMTMSVIADTVSCINNMVKVVGNLTCIFEHIKRDNCEVASTPQLTVNSELFVLGNCVFKTDNRGQLIAFSVYGTFLLNPNGNVQINGNLSYYGYSSSNLNNHTSSTMQLYVRGDLSISGNCISNSCSKMILDNNKSVVTINKNLSNDSFTDVNNGEINIYGNAQNINCKGQSKCYLYGNIIKNISALEQSQVILCGRNKQSISNLKANDLLIINDSDDGVDFVNNSYVYKYFNPEKSRILNGKNLFIDSANINSNTINGDINLIGNIVINKELIIQGNLYTGRKENSSVIIENNSIVTVLGNAELKATSHGMGETESNLIICDNAKLNINGNLLVKGENYYNTGYHWFALYVYGCLSIGGDFEPQVYNKIYETVDSSHIIIHGNIIWNEFDGELSAGVFEINGDYYAKSRYIKSTGTHLFKINGSKTQNISGNLNFLILEINNYYGVNFNSNLKVSTLFNHNGNPFTLYNDGKGSSFPDYDGDGYNDNVDPYPLIKHPDDHDYIFSKTVEPTCVEKGYDAYICPYCNSVDKRNLVDMIPHNYIYYETVLPTCTAQGYDLYTCSVCNSTEKRNIVSANGHKYSFTNTVEPTCTAQGYDLYTCSVCNSTEKRNIVSANGHKYSFTSTVEPTCTAQGYDLYTCSVCNSTEKRNTVSSTGHSYEVTSNTATCTEAGIKTSVCSKCGDTTTTEVSALGHSYSKEYTKPTCTESGGYTNTCTRCGDITYSTYDANGHDYGEVIGNDYINKIAGSTISATPEYFDEFYHTSSSIGSTSKNSATSTNMAVPNEIRLDINNMLEVSNYQFGIKGGIFSKRNCSGIFAYNKLTGRSPEQSAIPYTDNCGNLVNMHYVDYMKDNEWICGEYILDNDKITDASGNVVCSEFENTRPHIIYTQNEAIENGVMNDDGTVNVNLELVETQGVSFSAGIPGVYFTVTHITSNNSRCFINVFEFDKNAKDKIKSGKYDVAICFYNTSVSGLTESTFKVYDKSELQKQTDENEYTLTCIDCGENHTEICDKSAIVAALNRVFDYSPDDYSKESLEILQGLYDKYEYMSNSYSSQEQIDSATREILTAITELVPYLNLDISSPNGTFTVSYNGETNSNNNNSLLFGTNVTVSATANDGYEFVGWYDTINNLYFSKNPEYSFKLTTNTSLKAVFVKEQSATLTFTTYSNWVQSTVTKTIDEWNNITSIDELLPVVPYRYGYSNGRWVYDNAEVLAKLQTGENVSLIPEYDEDDTSLPTPPSPNGDTPVLDLHYKLDADANVGSFVMAAGIPENCQIESVGIAFYYKNADEFDPTKFELLINNKMLAGRFNTDEIEDIYIVNMNKMSANKNWAARGYVTYYDADGNLKTVYSNQINIVNREQV